MLWGGDLLSGSIISHLTPTDRRTTLFTGQDFSVVHRLSRSPWKVVLDESVVEEPGIGTVASVQE